MPDLHITLLAAAIATLIGVWLGIRCIAVRGKEQIAHGDGGHGLLQRRMRAQANFVEYTPLALILIAGLELAGKAGWPLALAALAFLLGRVLHALGMDSEGVPATRKAGMMLTFTVLLGLALAAVLVAFRVV